MSPGSAMAGARPVLAPTEEDAPAGGGLQCQRLDTWEWRRDETGAVWETVSLPHTAVSTDPDGRGHWLGRSRYRRRVQITDPQPHERHAVYFGAAMQTAEVRVDGRPVATHHGGYLPFEVDLTRLLEGGGVHLLEVLLDHADDPDVPPGKPLAELDFCRYGGLYREVELRRYPPLHITEAVAVNEPSGGGILAITQSATADEAVVDVTVHVLNAWPEATDGTLRFSLVDGTGHLAAWAETVETFRPGEARRLRTTLRLRQPRLWSVQDPHRHMLVVALLDADGAVLDQRTLPFGVRTVSLTRAGGLQLNGQRLRARGANRHQDHPWVGYALPPAAQRRDAVRLKAAGFDYVRLSHYPQCPHFLDACDELGILVMTCLPGWQHFGGEAFQQACQMDARTMIRRDRNHACVILWELSLNETPMTDAFMEVMNRIAREEYPGGHLLTCGWLEGFDVFLRSRQHGQLHTWQNGDQALVVAEYGDWEYYAANEGFDQGRGLGLLDPARNSRARRGDGALRQRQQAKNQAEALLDCQRSPAALNGLWSMFDYPRGYDAHRAACGVMDVFRLPKFACHFFRSQRPPECSGQRWGGPMVFIAAHGTTLLPAKVDVYSNLSHIELRVDGESLGVQHVQVCPETGYRHPVTFDLSGRLDGGLASRVASRLEAVAGDDHGREATHQVSPPGVPCQLHVWVDDLGVTAHRDEPDLLFCHAEVQDRDGTGCVEVATAITLTVDGEATIRGPNVVATEAGVASFVLTLPSGIRGFRLQATAPALANAVLDYGSNFPLENDTFVS